jgi:predicted Ser/Thr protein kinase
MSLNMPSEDAAHLGTGTEATDAGWRVQRDHARERVRARLFGADAAAPIQVGRFELRDRLGEGGMGVVFRAHDPKLDREVALKVVRSQALANALANDEGLVREAQAMARVTHPNVAAIHEVGEHDGAVFVAMELVDGGTLRDWLGERRDVKAILDVMLGAARGLSAAHERGLVHRDVKPENVLVGADDRARVVDFGLVLLTLAAGGQPLESGAGSFSSNAAMAGTIAYMSPEQLRGELADSLSDQFGFCATCFEALFGARPFVPAEGPELLSAIERGELHTVARSHPAQHLLPCLRRGLHPDSGARFPTMAALIAAIESADARHRRDRSLRRAALVALPIAALAAVAVVSFARRSTAPSPPDEVIDFPAYVELSELVQRGHFRECVEQSKKYEPSAQLLTMRIECARAAKGAEELAEACGELSRRFPDLARPAACAEELARVKALFEAGRYHDCIDAVEAAEPDVLLLVQMHLCAAKLRDRNTFVRVCRFAATHFPDKHRLEDCPTPVPDGPSSK